MAVLARQYGYQHRLVSTRALRIPIVELRAAGDRVGSALAREAAAAVHEGADVVILGCTVGSFAIGEAARALAAEGVDVPLIDPLVAAALVAEAAVVTIRAAGGDARGETDGSSR
jgi:allantoin racemase